MSRLRAVVSVVAGAALLALAAGGTVTALLNTKKTPAASSVKAQGPSSSPDPVFLRKPYLMQPRMDSIIVAWLTPAWATDGKVTVSGTGIKTTTRDATPQPAVDGTLHGATLSNLSPGGSYTYKVESGGGTFTGHFRTLPSSGPVRFVTMGDFGGATANEQGVADLMTRQDPDLFITLGDNTYERGTVPEMDANVFPQLGNFLSSHGAIWVMGNHDHTTQKGVPTLTNFFMPDRNYSFDAGDVHFTVLEADGSNGYAPGQPYYDFLAQDLAAHQSARWKFVFFHYPAYSCGVHGSTAWVDHYWVPLFDEYKVDAVFNGHDHDYERVRPDTAGVHYFVAGIGGKSADRVRNNCSFQQFAASNVYGDLAVTVNSNSVTVQAVESNGHVLDSTTWSK